MWHSNHSLFFGIGVIVQFIYMETSGCRSCHIGHCILWNVGIVWVLYFMVTDVMDEDIFLVFDLFVRFARSLGVY